MGVAAYDGETWWTRTGSLDSDPDILHGGGLSLDMWVVIVLLILIPLTSMSFSFPKPCSFSPPPLSISC